MNGKKIALTVLLALVFCLAATGTAVAMSSSNYDLPWTALSGGGGGRNSANYALGDTLGQSAIGPSESNNYRLGSGYWYGIVYMAMLSNPPNAPASPQCEGETNPTDVTDPTPEFSWTFSDPDGGDTQGAYQILVASSPGNLSADNGDMWDSGKVSSSSSDISYAGTALAWGQTYYWKVKNWDNNDAEGLYCSQQQFSTASPPTEVWVDDDFDDSTPGWGYDHFDSIQDGIDTVSGSTVNVAAGYYTENITLVDGVEVLGAGADVTTIDGGQNGSVVTALGVTSATILDGFTITNGMTPYGGGMYNENSDPIVSNCIFAGNSSTGGLGGGMYNDNSDPIVTNCTFSSNSAAVGGGMYNEWESSPTVTNCTFSGNSATYGGGMCNLESSPEVSNCTFSGNTATHGGGMHNNTNSSPIVTNCILWDGGDEVNNDGISSPVVTYCDVQGGYGDPADNNINADPLFVDPGTGDFHLQGTSPCIDAGNNSAPSIPSTDFEGDTRIMDGDGDLVAVVDMGVDEYTPLPIGLLRVMTSPPLPSTISLNDLPRNGYGLDWVRMPTGSYMISFSDVPGFLTPTEVQLTLYPPGGPPVTHSLADPIEILPGVTTEVIATFTQLGQLRVETSPPLPATLYLAGNPMNAWGFWVWLEPGTYTLSFEDIGYGITPPATPVEILAGAMTHVVGDYDTGEAIIIP